jgi:hypothetical protein
VHARGDGTYAYSVRIEQGHVSCAAARGVLKAFMSTSVAPRGWACFRGHRSQGQRWAAACVNTGGAVARAYLLRKTG